MATKKKTPAVKKMTAPSIQKNESIRIERIDNGWLAIKEGVDKKGMYVTTKKFMEKNPLD